MKIKTGDTIHIKLDNNIIIEKLRKCMIQIVLPENSKTYNNIQYFLIEYIAVYAELNNTNRVELCEKRLGTTQQMIDYYIDKKYKWSGYNRTFFVYLELIDRDYMIFQDDTTWTFSIDIKLICNKWLQQEFKNDIDIDEIELDLTFLNEKNNEQNFSDIITINGKVEKNIKL